MKHFLTALLTFLSIATASAQTSPNLRQGQVLTPAQWNQLFINKQDTLGYTPLNSAGGTMSGRLITASVPNGVSAGFNLTPGSAPPTPVNGDLWTTSTGLFAQINGSTIGPFSSGSSGSFTATSPITVNFPGAGVTNYACATCGVTGSSLAQFASTTSVQLAGVISDETGSGLLVFGTAPTLTGVTITTSFTATGLVGLTNLANQATNTVLANITAGSASPTALAVASCTGPSNALQWVTNTGFSCAAIVAAAGSVAIGTTTITSGTNTRILYNNAGVLGEYTITGTGTTVAMSVSPAFSGTMTFAGSSSGTTGLAASAAASGTLTLPAATDTLVARNTADTLTNKTLTAPVLTNPVLGVATATSLALGGCTIGASALCATGSAAISSTLTSAAHAITSASANALVAGVNGSTNPAFNVDASTASSATGINIKSAAAGDAVAISVISSGTNENLTINAKGSGAIAIASTSTGQTQVAFGGGGLAVGSALTYGGVALSNSVTGTGSMVLSASPTFTGTVTMPAVNMSGAVAITSNSGSALTVGLNGATNPVLQIDASGALQVTGIKITGQGITGGASIAVISSGANENLAIDAKGSGTITIGGVSTGAITLTRQTTLVNALNYGGVLLSNSVTGTGSMVLSAAPTITGNVTLQGVTSTGATGTGNIVFGTNPSIANLTVTSAFTATGLVTYAALNSAAIATTANYLAGASSVIVPASIIYTSETTTTYGATTTFNFDTFINTAVTLTGNITTQTLSNVKAGKAGSITFIQGGSGSYTSVWNSVFKFAGGTTPTLSTAVGAVDILFYSCRSATNCPASLVKDVR